MSETIIDRLYKDFFELITFLDQAGEVSLRIVADSTFKKTLALSAASYFEDEIRRILLDMVEKKSNSDAILSNFVKNKAIARQYHSFFQWKEKNANSFWGLFGDEFRDEVKRDVRENDALSDSIKSFLELGDLRNELAHLNFANFILDKTADEVFSMYKNALIFISYLDKKLNGRNNANHNVKFYIWESFY